MPGRYILAIDAGTTGVRTFIVDRQGRTVRQAYSEFTQHTPRPGWVEHDADEIWEVARRLMKEVVDASGGPREIAAIGITNQRETTVLWDRKTAKPLHRAIVWQCRRTADICRALKAQGKEPLFRQRTGLVLDAYFSGTKVKWLLDEVKEARPRAADGAALFGTIDSWLVFKLTGGKVHATDPTNASRTLLYDIHERRWHPDLLAALDVPAACLPAVRPSSGDFGRTDPKVTGEAIPVAGIAGDQQAALFGQGCVRAGEAKNTYGTGCFALVQSGDRAVESHSGLITTVACGPRGEASYALEGSVFIAGAAVQWLRDRLGIIKEAKEIETLAASVPDAGGVHFVPAFVGLGAPYWDMDARGAILGITRGTSAAHIARATLEGIAFQTADLLAAFEQDLGRPVDRLRVDGGAVRNDLLLQIQADVLGKPIERPRDIETTVLGAAYLAGLGTGYWKDPREVTGFGAIDRVFEPKIDGASRDALLAGWKEAVRRVRS